MGFPFVNGANLKSNSGGAHRNASRVRVWLINITVKRIDCAGLWVADQLWFRAEPIYRPKYQVELGGRANSDDAFWLVAAWKQQLALVSYYGFHGISFR
jgi:hypothetical protein